MSQRVVIKVKDQEIEMTRSEIFSVYNKARAAARKGIGGLDEKRVNRAFGYLLSGEFRPYNTTIKKCDCPDAIRNPGIVCKHRAELMIITRIVEGQR